MKARLLLPVFFVTSLALAQAPKELLQKIQNKFNSIDNFTANYTQVYYNLQGQGTGKTSGKFNYKRKNKFVVEIKNQVIVSDGTTIWNSDKKFNRVVISSFSDDPTSFSLERFVFDYPPLCKIKILKNEPAVSGESVLELTPKDQDMAFDDAKIWVNQDGMISKLEVTDRGDVKYLFQFADIKINQDLPDSRFIYYPPKGMQIIDIR
jgi:outer membrane lipoprotein carrier protein